MTQQIETLQCELTEARQDAENKDKLITVCYTVALGLENTLLMK